MADKKISALTAAATPLAGTEVLPIVQSGATVKVSVDNLTNGKTVTANKFYAPSTDATPIDIRRSVANNTVLANVADSPSLSNANYVLFGIDVSGGSVGYSSGGAFVSTGANGTGTARPLILHTYGNNDIVFARQNTQIASITANGLAFAANKGITTGGATALGFGVNNAVDAMTIDTSKNVGVGTASPAVKLHVSGTLDEVFRLTSTGSPYISWYAGVTRRGYIQAQSGSFAVASDTDIPLLLSTNSTERLRIKSTGGVRYVPLDAAPATPDAGEVYYDNLTNKLRCYNGTTWNDLF